MSLRGDPRGQARGEMRGGCMQHLGREESGGGCGGMAGVSQAAWKKGGRPGPAWLLQEEYNGEDLAPTRLLWLLMVKRWPGAWMEVGRAIREGTAITLGPPHHLLFLSSPVCFPLGIISDKNPRPC